MRSPPSIIPPRRLVLAGGGIRVVSYVGVLEALQERNLLQSIREFCGVSAGALSALMLALGYSVDFIRRFVLKYDFTNVRSIDPDHVLEFLDDYGIDTGENLQRLVRVLLKHKGHSPTATFQELADSGRCKRLRVWAADIQFTTPVEFSVTTTPTVQVVTAIHASMAVPLYFKPVIHPLTETLLVDGGIFENYPMDYLTEEEAKETLGVTFQFSHRPLEVTDFSRFLTLITTGHGATYHQKVIGRHEDRTIIIPCAEFPMMHFEASQEDRERLIEIGRSATEHFLNNVVRPVGRRRSIN
jgi:predicted acylesterase/phospholipase RssA